MPKPGKLFICSGSPTYIVLILACKKNKILLLTDSGISFWYGAEYFKSCWKEIK